MDTQLKKGLIEGCVLKELSRRESYGYKIIESLPKVLEVSESTLYPVLRRLENVGHVVVHTAEHSGRLRRYYNITEQGKARLEEYKEDLNDLVNIYNYIWL